MKKLFKIIFTIENLRLVVLYDLVRAVRLQTGGLSLAFMAFYRRFGALPV